MMGRRIEQAKTDYEAEIFKEAKERYANLFSLQDKFRTALDEERKIIREEIANERRVLRELYNKYNSHQWELLGKEFGVKDIEEFVKQAQTLAQRRQLPLV